jgi:hypothetical protein
METSEEGNEKGLGWIEGRVIRFRSNMMPAENKIPHMSWTDVNQEQANPFTRISGAALLFCSLLSPGSRPEYVTATLIMVIVLWPQWHTGTFRVCNFILRKATNLACNSIPTSLRIFRKA